MENNMGGTTKDQKLRQISGQIGSRHDRKLKKFSDSFNEKFSFFLKIYRSGLIEFCGEDVNIRSDKNSNRIVCAKEGFRLFEDGQFSHRAINSKHPNILRAVIIGKKGWGLWVNQWAEGINEWSFTKEEILNEFKIRDITIPQSFLKDFENRIEKLRQKRLEDHWQELYGNS